MSPDQKARYEKCISEGCSERLAEMLALQAAPGVQTDNTHFAGRMGRQFVGQEVVGDFYARELRKMGGSPAGKVYVHQLARYSGDPEAWVASTGEIADRCRERGWGLRGDGAPEVRAVETEGSPAVALDESIVTDHVEAAIADNPEIAPTPKEKTELRNKTRDRLLGHKKK